MSTWSVTWWECYCTVPVCRDLGMFINNLVWFSIDPHLSIPSFEWQRLAGLCSFIKVKARQTEWHLLYCPLASWNCTERDMNTVIIKLLTSDPLADSVWWSAYGVHSPFVVSNQPIDQPINQPINYMKSINHIKPPSNKKPTRNKVCLQ